jgi:hypothetical protein
MGKAKRILSGLETITMHDIAELSPDERARFVELCLAWAEIAKPRPTAPGPGGVLVELKDWKREE